MNLEQHLDTRISLADITATEQFKRAPILYSLTGIENFTHKVQESLDTLRAKTTLFIFGEPGAGKEIIGGQLLDTLLHPASPGSLSPLSTDTIIGYVSFGMAMKIARDPDLSQKYGEVQITRTDGDYTKEEYSTASRIMDKLIEDFHAKDPDRPHLLIAEAVGFTYPTYDHAGSVIKNQQKTTLASSNRNVFLLGLVAYDQVQDLAFIPRNLAARQAKPQELHAAFSDQQIVFDNTPFPTQEDVSIFAKTRGNNRAREKARKTINDNAWSRRRILHLMNGDIPKEPTHRDLFGSQTRRRQTHRAHFMWMADRDFGLQQERTLITDNPPLRRYSGKIPYYRNLIQKYALVS